MSTRYEGWLRQAIDEYEDQQEAARQHGYPPTRSRVLELNDQTWDREDSATSSGSGRSGPQESRPWPQDLDHSWRSHVPGEPAEDREEPPTAPIHARLECGMVRAGSMAADMRETLGPWSTFC